MNHYLAIVIGPVYKTILQARSTREIWAASYLYSILMREILEAAHSQGLTNLLSPEKLPSNAHKFGAGIYPDKAFWELHSPDDHAKLPAIKQQALLKIEEKTGVKANILGNAIRLYGVYYGAAANDPKAALEALNERLDILELQEKIPLQSPEVLWNNIIDSIQNLYIDGHPNGETGIFIEYNCIGTKLIRLPSIIEIATRDLKDNQPLQNQPAYDNIITNPISQDVCELIENETVNKRRTTRKEYNEKEEKKQDSLIGQLKTAYGKHFRFRHKYVAFVLADGDNMGASLQKIGNDPVKISAFSKALSNFTQSATGLIVKYGGIPIYAGGDDLLFALPLGNANDNNRDEVGQNLFELISKIDATFPTSTFQSLTGNLVTPSMSYGLSVGYYKQPMDSLLKECHAALYKAKDMAGKHAVAFQVKKHSGQLFAGCIPIVDSYRQFFGMMNTFNQFDDEAFLASVTFKLAPLEKLVVDALLHGSVEYFFKNQFNEKHHGTKYDKYLKASREYMEKAFEECKTVFSAKINSSKPDLKGNFEAAGFTKSETEDLANKGVLRDAALAAAHYAARQLYGCMRFIQFINQKDHE